MIYSLRNTAPLLGGYVLLALLTPLTTYAQDFVPLVGIPFVETGAPMSLKGYADALYIGAISLGAVIAVLKIIFAGVKYMLTDVVTDKSSAKADIKGALLGLVIMIGAVLLLNTINPQITEVTALNLEEIPVDVAPPSGGQGDQCELWGINQNTGERECRARESDTENTNLDELINPGITSGELVVSITQEEQWEAINENDNYDELLETSRNEAARLCGVNPTEVNEVIPPGFVGVFYYCPGRENGDGGATGSW